MPNRLKRTIIAAGTYLFVGGAALTSAAQTAPEATAALVVPPVAIPRVLLRIREREVSMPLTDVRRVAAPDPLSNGIRNGAVIGAIGAGTAFGVIAWRSCESRVCTVGDRSRH